MKNKDLNATVMDMIEEELHSINKIKDVSISIQEFNKIKYPPPKHYSANDICNVRKKLKVSQAVFAYLLNAKVSTVQKWERGDKNPSGANNRLLQILDRNGLGILMEK